MHSGAKSAQANDKGSEPIEEYKRGALDWRDLSKETKEEIGTYVKEALELRFGLIRVIERRVRREAMIVRNLREEREKHQVMIRNEDAGLTALGRINTAEVIEVENIESEMARLKELLRKNAEAVDFIDNMLK